MIGRSVGRTAVDVAGAPPRDTTMSAEGRLLVVALDMRDLLDVIAGDDDVPTFRRNEARTAVGTFDFFMEHDEGDGDES